MDITSLLGNVMDKDMLEKLSKSAKVSTTDEERCALCDEASGRRQ